MCGCSSTDRRCQGKAVTAGEWEGVQGSASGVENGDRHQECITRLEARYDGIHSIGCWHWPPAAPHPCAATRLEMRNNKDK
jgi:hypothetical protein